MFAGGSNIDAKFGPAPARGGSVVSVLSIQFMVAVAILYGVRPPFVCDARGQLQPNTVLALALFTTTASVVAHVTALSPWDCVRGAAHVFLRG